VLADRIIRFIEDPATDRFETLALEVFAHQYASNPPYRAYCKIRGVLPERVSRWDEIPVVHTDAFKEHELACGTPQATFFTTGTKYGPEKRGRHLVPRLDVYRASALANFSRHVVPEGGRFRIVALVPSLAAAPHSSLAQMLDWVVRDFGSSVGYYLEGGRPDTERLRADLLEASLGTTPVLILAITRALLVVAHAWGWPDRAAVRRNRVLLPPGSRIMDTGGNKGLERAVSRHEIFAMAEELFGIGPLHVINEYGMTEMCSQFYDDSRACGVFENEASRRKIVPHWVRTRVVDPLTLDEVGEGGRGLLLHFDLANVESVSAILTEDIGERRGSGFEIMGRVSAAPPRGCSLAVESE